MVRYSKADGLPSNIVYNIYRDSKGFLWFATDKGVARYNGIRFDNFNTSNGLPSNEVLSFEEDGYGRLWMATYSGALCYYRNGEFHTPFNTPILKLPFKLPYIKFIIKEVDGSATIGFHNQPIFININARTRRVYNLRSVGIDGSPNDVICHISKTDSNGYMIITERKTVYIDTAGNLLRIKKRDSPNILGPIYGQSKYLLGTDGIYSSDLRRVHSLDNVKEVISGNILHSVIQAYSNGHRFFLCTSNGAWVDDSLMLLNDMAVTSITEDISGNYWLSTYGYGVFKIDPDLFGVNKYTLPLKAPVVYAYTDSNFVFLTTAANNLYRWRKGAIQQLLHYRTEKKSDVAATMLPVSVINKQGGYFNYYNSKNFVIKNIYSQHPQLYQYNCQVDAKSMFYAKEKLYMLSSDLIYSVDYTKQKSNTTLQAKLIEGHAKKQRIFSSTQDANGNIWFSGINGVHQVTSGNIEDVSELKGWSFKWMTYCNNYLVGATHEDKLIIYNINSRKAKPDTVKNTNDCIWNSSYRLDNRHILIATNTQYRILTLQSSSDIPIYSVRTIDNPFIPADAEFICSDGFNCWFFKDNGAYKISLNKLLTQNDSPRIFFTSLRTQKKVIPVSGRKDEHISLDFSESHNISASFAVLSFSSSHIIAEYSFSKNANDNTWIRLNEESIHLIVPDYGDHILKLRVRSVASSFCEPIVMYIHIATPIWATLWFRLVCLLLSITIITVIVHFILKYRIKDKEAKHSSEIRTLKSEYRALNALMNPHFIFNSLSSIQGMVYENNTKAANEYLQYFSDLVRQNMHNISQDLISLENEMNLVSNYVKLEALRFQDQLNYSIEIAEDLEIDLIMIPPLLIQPLVENAIKHGLLSNPKPYNAVTISLYESCDQTFIEVLDNGAGLRTKKQSSGYESYGLTNIEKRIAQLNFTHNLNIRFTIQEKYDSNNNLVGTLSTIIIDS